MPELSKSQRAALDKVERDIAAKRSQWHTLYNNLKGTSGSLVLVPGSTADQIYKELSALREKRNALLAQYRASGIKI